MPDTQAKPFFPEGYEVPQSSGKYMKLKLGPNRFRILGRPIIGNEGWREDDGRHPVRKRQGESFQPGEVDPEEKIKHFWAMPVWNYAEKRIQILELTQTTIMAAVKQLTEDADWGQPNAYDIVVSRVGEGLKTEYSVTPKPKATLDPEIAKEWVEVHKKLDLEQLFVNGDPFGDEPKKEPSRAAAAMTAGMSGTTAASAPATPDDEEINVEDIPF